MRVCIQILLNSTCNLDYSNSEPLILDVRKAAQECIESYTAQQNNKNASSSQNVAEKEGCSPTIVEEENHLTVVVEGESEKAFEGGEIETVAEAEVMEQ